MYRIIYLFAPTLDICDYKLLNKPAEFMILLEHFQEVRVIGPLLLGVKRACPFLQKGHRADIF